MLATLKSVLVAAAFVQAPSPHSDIVVTGQRLPDYRAALAACLARHCPVNEDVDASLALAEALFVEGDYGEARRTVRASLSRNRGYAARYPEPVSDLYRAETRVAEHMGLDREAQLAVYQILRALRTGIPQEDYRHFTARLEIVQYLANSGQAEGAQQELRRLMEVARASGRQDVADLAQLRLLYFDYLQARSGPTKQRLLEMARWTDPQRRLLSYGARVLLIRIYSAEHDYRRADALIAEMARNGDSSRQLLYTPRYQLTQQMDPEATNRRMQLVESVGDHSLLIDNLSERLTDTFEDKWIDVGFWVQPEGQVEDLQVLRHGRAGEDWADPLLVSIRGRRYSASERPTYRLERYTYTSTLHTTGTGTHIPDRSPRARIEYLDLTAAQPRETSPPASRTN